MSLFLIYVYISLNFIVLSNVRVIYNIESFFGRGIIARGQVRVPQTYKNSEH